MSKNPRDLDDVASAAPPQQIAHALSEVGLEGVQTLALITGQRTPARARAWVSLSDPHSRGIHMSRIYKILARLPEKELSWEWLNAALEDMLASHANLSDAGAIEVSLDFPLLRKALSSDESGWRTYPAHFQVSRVRGEYQQKLTLQVLYSSTCPCSAGLSRQLMQETFAERFKEDSLSREQVLAWLKQPESLVATPHAQRSEARCELIFAPGSRDASPAAYVDRIEAALGTPVQAAVKRADEQEFARRNAQNLMFCEDAARRLKTALLECAELKDFAIEVRHFESLHPHDVVAKVRKNSL